MKFKIDENLPAEIAQDLRSSGHDADTVVEEGIQGKSDPMVLAVAHAERRILFTLDKGIANVVRYPKEVHAGVVLFRFRSSGRGTVLAFVREHLPTLLELDLNGRLCVVTAAGVRIR